MRGHSTHTGSFTLVRPTSVEIFDYEDELTRHIILASTTQPSLLLDALIYRAFEIAASPDLCERVHKLIAEIAAVKLTLTPRNTPTT